MLFINNKYTTIYYQIIEQGQHRILPDDVYTERHHIIPRGCGGDNSEENLVKLTAREHYICHWLLIKITTGVYRHKMAYALALMRASNNNQSRYNSKSYENTKKIIHQLMKGREFTDEWKQNISNSKKGTRTWNKGIPRDDDTKRKMSETRKLQQDNPEWNIRPACKVSTKEKIRAANIGRRWAHCKHTKTRQYVILEEYNKLIAQGWSPGVGPRK